MPDLILNPKPDLNLASASTADLRSELARGLTLQAQVLSRLGAIWVELERRGEDLSDLRSGLARMLPLIAAGALAAEAVVAFASRPAVLRAIEGLPLDRQRSLAAGEQVEVVMPDAPTQTERMPLASLPAASLRVVFADGEMLPPNAQRLRLRQRRRSRPESSHTFRPRVDRAAGVVYVGRMAVPLAELLTALAADAGPDKPPTADDSDQYEYATATAKLWTEEKAALKAHAKNLDLPERELVRKALRAYGLLTMPAKGD